jgi:hypothetical protein
MALKKGGFRHQRQENSAIGQECPVTEQHAPPLQLQDRNHFAGGDDFRLAVPTYRQYPSFVACDQIVGFTSLRHCEQIVIVGIARDTRRW